VLTRCGVVYKVRDTVARAGPSHDSDVLVTMAPGSMVVRMVPSSLDTANCLALARIAPRTP
jgi:hypothetical protein